MSSYHCGNCGQDYRGPDHGCGGGTPAETITSGPVVTYTFTCGVCGAHYDGLGPHCPTVADLNALRRLGAAALHAFDQSVSRHAGKPFPAVAYAVAAEVLTDPRGWARALGLPDPPIMPLYGPVEAAERC